MGVKLGLSHYENTGWWCSKIGCRGIYLDL